MRSEEVSHSDADSRAAMQHAPPARGREKVGTLREKQALFSTIHPVFEKKEGGFCEGLAEN